MYHIDPAQNIRVDSKAVQDASEHVMSLADPAIIVLRAAFASTGDTCEVKAVDFADFLHCLAIAQVEGTTKRVLFAALGKCKVVQGEQLQLTT